MRRSISHNDNSNSYKKVSPKKNLDYFAEIESQKKERRLKDIALRIALSYYFDNYDESEVIRE